MEAQTAPVELTIADVAFGGAGVARQDGLVYFVPFTIQGERVTAEIVRKKKRFAEAELRAVEAPSPERATPPCPYFQRCGGCAYQHMSYAEQLRVKQAQVEQTLRRIGRLTEVPMRAIIGAPAPFEYRNRLRVHARDGVVGFYAHGGIALLDIKACAIARPEVNSSLAQLRAARPGDGDYTVAPPGRPSFFEQTNDPVARLLVETVGGVLPPHGELLVDAYCGAGLFAQGLRERFTKVIGIEENEFAIAQARRRAGENEQYLAGDVGAHLTELLGFRTLANATVVLDPPAAGVTARVLDLLNGSPPAELVYVSCHPGTLARDLAALCQGAFALRSVTPVDMFPQTAEIEVVAHLQSR